MGKVVAIIPARGGSKRLPRKNILPLGGVPLLARVIRTAREAGFFDEVIVSSEDEEILKLARREGAVAHIRPDDLATDRSTVVETCLDVLKSHNTDAFCCIYATSALLAKETLQLSAQKFFSDKKAGVLMGVSKYNYHPVQALKIEPDGSAKLLFPEYQGAQSQFYPDVRVSNGTFYWARVASFVIEKTFYSESLRLFDVPIDEAFDIDTADDYQALVEAFEARC